MLGGVARRRDSWLDPRIETIDGRWLVDFGGVCHLNQSGKELILSEGSVTVAQTGAPIGTYEVRDELLAITINLPALAGESSGRLMAKILLPARDEAVPQLPRIVEPVQGDQIAGLLWLAILCGVILSKGL